MEGKGLSFPYLSDGVGYELGLASRYERGTRRKERRGGGRRPARNTGGLLGGRESTDMLLLLRRVEHSTFEEIKGKHAHITHVSIPRQGRPKERKEVREPSTYDDDDDDDKDDGWVGVCLLNRRGRRAAVFHCGSLGASDSGGS